MLSVPVLEKVLRPCLVYFFLVIGLRLAGKRELAQINTFDLIVLLTLSNTVQNAIIGNDNSLSGGVIGAASLLVLNVMWSCAFYSTARAWIGFSGGQADGADRRGQAAHKEPKVLAITEAELLTVAHKQGYRDLHDIERAILGDWRFDRLHRQRPCADTDPLRGAAVFDSDEISRQLGASSAEVSKRWHVSTFGRLRFQTVRTLGRSIECASRSSPDPRNRSQAATCLLARQMLIDRSIHHPHRNRKNKLCSAGSARRA